MKDKKAKMFGRGTSSIIKDALKTNRNILFIQERIASHFSPVTVICSSTVDF